jgi:hypothetical protein
MRVGVASPSVPQNTKNKRETEKERERERERKRGKKDITLQ